MSEPTEFTPAIPQVRAAPELIIGAASPLWGYFVGAAATGVAWWWMTRWAQPENLEAMFGLAERANQRALAPLNEGSAVAGFAADTAEQALQAAPQIADAAAQSASESLQGVAPVAEAIIEPILLPEIVGGEAAPISPLVDVATPETPAREPRKAKAQAVEPVPRETPEPE